MCASSVWGKSPATTPVSRRTQTLHAEPQHPGDMRGQIGLALDNLEAVLKSAGMDLSNVARLVVYATDVDAALSNFDLLGGRFGPHGAAPPMTLLGVTRLAMPGLLFEIEATAVA